MILAAADAAEGGDEPPPLVRAALQHGAVDRAEYLEQPAILASRMRRLNYVYRAMKGYRNAGKAQQTVPWTRQHPDEWDLVTHIINMRREQRGG